jgi:hypothetical protein
VEAVYILVEGRSNSNPQINTSAATTVMVEISQGTLIHNQHVCSRIRKQLSGEPAISMIKEWLHGS